MRVRQQYQEAGRFWEDEASLKMGVLTAIQQSRYKIEKISKHVNALTVGMFWEEVKV